MFNTGGWRGYDGLVDVGLDYHVRVRHGREEFVVGASHINRIESCWRFAKSRLQHPMGHPMQAFLLPLKWSEFRFSHYYEGSLNYLVNSCLDWILFLVPMMEVSMRRSALQRP